jgi:hypothetical protein
VKIHWRRGQPIKVTDAFFANRRIARHPREIDVDIGPRVPRCASDLVGVYWWHCPPRGQEATPSALRLRNSSLSNSAYSEPSTAIINVCVISLRTTGWAAYLSVRSLLIFSFYHLLACVLFHFTGAPTILRCALTYVCQFRA